MDGDECRASLQTLTKKTVMFRIAAFSTTAPTLSLCAADAGFRRGRQARALATMVAALAQPKETGIDGAALQDALAFIDWADDGN